jgi:predicted choloylglycine hydrolase
MLREHMPELVPIWEHLSDLAGGDRDVRRMLALYRPTPYVSGCTQAVLPGPSPILVRNYDYHPHACEGTFVRTRWLGTTVLASSDCLWGVLDGINEHGLAVALSFGGSRAVGDGFGIPLILRYVLESCATVAEARAVLRRIPCHMAYNVSLVDRGGAYAVAYLRPGKEPVIVRDKVATNHQRPIDWPAYARATRSEERKRFTQASLRDLADEDALVALFLQPPLYVTDYVGWHGTLYTACYRTEDCSASVYWPGASVYQTVDRFTECDFDVPYSPTG